MPWRWGLACVGLLGALYGPHVWSAGFVYEDAVWRPEMTATASLPFQSRVLTRASWRLTETPQAAHALGVGLHAGVVGLLGLLAWRLGYSRDGVGLVALLATVHPLTVESVAYASARSELLAAIGALLAVVCAAGRWWRPWYLTGMVTGIVLGWMGKESAIVALALVPLTMLLRARRPFLVAVFVLVCVGGATAIDGQDVKALANIGESGMMQTTAGSWFLLQAAAAYRLIGLAIWPVGLAVDADIDAIPRLLQWWAVVALGGIVASLAALVRTHRRVAYGLAWCLLCLAPRLVVQTPRGYFNEHHFYLSLLGLILAGVAWWDDWRDQHG